MQRDRIFRIAFFAALAAFAAYALWHYVYWTACPYPNEFREAVLLQLGDLFSRGVNPYSESGPDNFCFIYGFIEPLVAAGLSRVVGAGVRFVEPRLVTLFFTFAAAALVEIEVRHWSKRRTPPFLAFLLALNAGWVLGEVDTRPDHFGLFCLFAALACVSRGVSWWRLALSALLTVLSFYGKQYCILIGGPIFLYLLLKRPWRAFVYAAFAAAFLCGSMLLVERVFPFYFTTAVLVFLGHGYDLKHMLIQTTLYVWFYWPLMLAFAAGAWIVVKSRTVNAPENDGLRLYSLAAIAMFAACTFKFGGNPGAIMSYYNQLFLTPFLAAALICLPRLCEAGWSRALLPVVYVGTLVFSLWHVGPNPRGFMVGSFAFTRPHTAAEVAAWEAVREEIAKCPAGKVLLDAPYFVDMALARGDRDFEVGHSLRGEFRNNIVKPELRRVRELFFPNAERALRHYDAYVARTLSRLDSGDYDLIVIAKEDTQLGCARIPSSLYEERGNYSIRSGEQVRTVALYRRR